MKIVITGANRGIGFELCRQLVARYKPSELYAACRRSNDKLNALGVNVIEEIDITQEQSRKKLANQLPDHIDILINNAGIIEKTPLGFLQKESIAKMLDVNATAPLLLTQELTDKLSSGSKVIFISSILGSMGENNSGNYYGYRMSKAALNAAAKSLAVDLYEQGISVGIFHPGHLATDMGGDRGLPIEGPISQLIQQIEECSLENSANFQNYDGKSLSW